MSSTEKSFYLFHQFNEYCKLGHITLQSKFAFRYVSSKIQRTVLRRGKRFIKQPDADETRPSTLATKHCLVAKNEAFFGKQPLRAMRLHIIQASAFSLSLTFAQFCIVPFCSAHITDRIAMTAICRSVLSFASRPVACSLHSVRISFPVYSFGFHVPNTLTGFGHMISTINRPISYKCAKWPINRLHSHQLFVLALYKNFVFVIYIDEGMVIILVFEYLEKYLF